MDSKPPTARRYARKHHTGASPGILYDRNGVQITHQWLLIGIRRYPLNTLQNLRKTRGPTDRTARRCVSVAALALPALLAIGPCLPPFTVVAAFGALITAPLALAAGRALRRPAPHILCADCHGSPVQLYQTTDAVEFGKLSRALVRAKRLSRSGVPADTKSGLADSSLPAQEKAGQPGRTTTPIHPMIHKDR